MSNFTTELRYILESYNGQTENGPASKVNEVIDNTRTSLFDFDYPHASLTQSEKEHLEKHIMLHYYTREIGFETMGLFKLKLESKLWDIMPKYEKLYALEHLNLDFFSDVDYTRKLDSQTDQDGFTSKMTGSVDHQNSGKETNITTGGWKDQKDGGTTETTSGSIENEDNITIDRSKDGKIIEGTEFGKVVTQTGSEIDAKSGSDDKIISGTIEKEIEFGKTSTESGGYTDETTYGKTEETSGGYTDTFTGDQRNLHSDTPQSAVDITNASEAYVSDLQKRIDNLETQRTYDDQVVEAGGTDSTSRTFNNQKNTEGGTQTETTKYGGGVSSPYDEETSYNSSNTKTFNNRASTDSGDETKTTEFDDYNEKEEHSGSTEEIYHDLKREVEDDSSVQRTYNSLKVEDENLKKLTDTYQNLMNEIDKTDVVDLTERIYGNVHGNNIEKFIKYKDNILNIELMIIKDLNVLFMGLWC